MLWSSVCNNVRLLLDLVGVLWVEGNIWVSEVFELVGFGKFVDVLLCEFFGGM